MPCSQAVGFLVCVRERYYWPVHRGYSPGLDKSQAKG